MQPVAVAGWFGSELGAAVGAWPGEQRPVPGPGSVWINTEITPEQQGLQISSAKTIK